MKTGRLLRTAASIGLVGWLDYEYFQLHLYYTWFYDTTEKEKRVVFGVSKISPQFQRTDTVNSWWFVRF